MSPAIVNLLQLIQLTFSKWKFDLRDGSQENNKWFRELIIFANNFSRRSSSSSLHCATHDHAENHNLESCLLAVEKTFKWFCGQLPLAVYPLILNVLYKYTTSTFCHSVGIVLYCTIQVHPSTNAVMEHWNYQQNFTENFISTHRNQRISSESRGLKFWVIEIFSCDPNILIK